MHLHRLGPGLLDHQHEPRDGSQFHEIPFGEKMTLTPLQPETFDGDGCPDTAIRNYLLLAFIGSAEAQEGGEAGDFSTEALSIWRLEGSRWRGGYRGLLAPITG